MKLCPKDLSMIRADMNKVCLISSFILRKEVE